MLIQRQLRNRIFDDAERLRKKSSELCHACCNTMSVSLLLINVVQQERKQRPLVRSKQSTEGHGMRNQTST